MAPMGTAKRRPQAVSDEDSDIEIGDETISSNLDQRDSRKKARHSYANDGDTDPDLSASSLGAGDDMDVTDDGEADEDNYRELTDDAAMQRMGDIRHQQGLKENHPAENAIIEEIECYNFMCHEHLAIKIGPLINFIIGHNGSGKSAVLTALTICLGGKATSTNRAQNLKAFIKNDRETARLIVRIKNQGLSAYKKDVFGKSIVVERHFSRSGASGFKIKNAHDKLISTKKTELEEILDFYALQLDNPMNVLTQDMARQFLSNSTAQDKYKFFHKGTQLEQLDNDYKTMEQTLDENEIRIRVIMDQKANAKTIYDRAKKDAEKVANQQKLKDQITRLSFQLAWSQVRDQEDELNAVDDEIRELDQVVQDKKRAADQSSEEFDQAELTIGRAKEAIEALKVELQQPLEHQQEIEASFAAGKLELQNIIQEQRMIKSELKSSQNDVNLYAGKIREEEEKLRDVDDGRPAMILEEIHNSEAEFENAREEQKDLESDLRQRQQEVENTKQQTSRASFVLQEKRDAVQKQQHRIAQIEKDRGRVQLGSSVKALLRAIDQESRFREKPVGPISQHVHLLQPRWSSILERQSGAMLDAFCVTSKADQNLLTQLVNRLNWDGKPQPRIIIGNARPLDTSANEPDQSLTTWMRVLRIDNDLVRNTLIINQGIDQTVLIPDRQEAVNLNRTRPSFVKQIFCLHDDQERRVGEGHRLSMTGGGEQMSPIYAWKTTPRMLADVEARLQAERETYDAHKRTYNDADRAYQDAQKRNRDCVEAFNQLQRAIKAKKVAVQRLEDKIGKLREDLELATPQTGLLDQHKENLRVAQDKVQADEETFKDSVTAKDNLNLRQRDLKAQMDAAGEEVNVVKAKIEKSETRLQKSIKVRQERLYEKNEAFEVVSRLEKEKEQKEAERAVVEATVADFTAQASDFCARVPLDRGATTKLLEQKYEESRKVLERTQREMGGTEEELKERELEAKETFDELCATLDANVELAQALKFSLANRKERWEKFREFISIRAKTSFTYLLSERQFRGTLVINHPQKLLDIQVEPDITRKSDKGRQTKTLSGGEKSFSTICLLLALWEAMGSPIRCLDEFDVFMDNVNRDVSMKMMIEAARRAVSRQFILITPQGMSSLASDSDVKIHRMVDPERGQTALPFVRA